jgi:predicted RNase H-like nuclease
MKSDLQAIAGLDGARGGFLAAFSETGALSDARIALVDDLAAFLARPFAALAVDMPIGLPERVGPGGRGPERALRPLLGARQSSVFAIPSRRAVLCEEYRAACAAALATSDPPKKVSKQAFFLFAKIREIDALLRGDAALAARVFESHPEGCFAAMKGGPLDEPKKLQSRPYGPGLDERRALLAAQGFSRTLLEASPPKGAGADDMLDALACLWAARRIRDGEAIRHGEGARDAFGLEIAIRC